MEVLGEGNVSRIAVVSIIIDQEGDDVRKEVNRLLQQSAQYIVGRLGLPYRQRNISVIVVVLDAPVDAVSALAGKIGTLPGVAAKATYSKHEFPFE